MESRNLWKVATYGKFPENLSDGFGQKKELCGVKFFHANLLKQRENGV